MLFQEEAKKRLSGCGYVLHFLIMTDQMTYCISPSIRQSVSQSVASFLSLTPFVAHGQPTDSYNPNKSAFKRYLVVERAA
jgi:hypothetical protein